jgi:DNA-binding NarL/FixJ family response regulator
MGGMNGVDASIAIRELQPKCRILLVSGHNHTAEILKAANGKGHSFEILAKPVHPLILLATLRDEPRPAMDY